MQETPAEDALDLLIGCHDRIRHFTAMAAKLAHAQGATPQEISSAAYGVYRYYSVSLPLHEADEEQTLRPRLCNIADERVQRALAAMGEQHQSIEALVERLLPVLLMVQNNPDTLHQAGAELCSLTNTLQEMFTAHLQLEEEVIFPAVRELLPAGTREEMLREMQQRRKE